MQTLDIHRPEMPNLQFVLLVTANLYVSSTTLNIPYPLRATIFNRCWTLIHDSPPPGRPEERVLDLQPLDRAHRRGDGRNHTRSAHGG